MARTAAAASGRRRAWLAVVAAFVLIFTVYAMLTSAIRRPHAMEALSNSVMPGTAVEAMAAKGRTEERGKVCCHGVQGLELWGEAVNWGSSQKVDSVAKCCAACKAMPGRCNSWVYCGDKDRCKDKLGECWLKRQKDIMQPAISARGESVMWTSGIVYGKGEGIIHLETDIGPIRVQLSDCALNSVIYILELLRFRVCSGCLFYRAEERGNAWDSSGNHRMHASYGPPYALLQGALEIEGNTLDKIPSEGHSAIERGSVAWVNSGPEFFISLANHSEWKNRYTVFGSVLTEDMEIVEKLSRLPVKKDVWSDINVSLLKDPVYIKLKINTTTNSS